MSATTCHDGFTRNDLVSYDRKHNEVNGEDNRDGSDSYSLACTIWSLSGRSVIHLMVSAYWEPLGFELPVPPPVEKGAGGSALAPRSGRGGNPSRMALEKSSMASLERARAVISLRRFSSSSGMLVSTVPRS